MANYSGRNGANLVPSKHTMTDQNNTAKSFFDKWKNNPKLLFESTSTEHTEVNNWILARNGFPSLDELKSFLSSKKRVLDAGCGNGRVMALFRSLCDVPLVGIDLVAAPIAQENFVDEPNMTFKAMDLVSDLTSLGQFDFIYCQEVLHHTNNPRGGFSNLVKLLEKDGEIAIYVYKKKAPVREYSDDYIRNRIADLSYEDAMVLCREITDFGKALAEMNQSVSIPEVKALDIPAGTYDIQRLFYHFFVKCFWNPENSHEDNAVINYDWFHPQLCSRHTVEEITQWFRDEGLHIVHTYVDFYGITMRGIKK
jgi:SAM-dependent methyltransferase